MHVDSRGNPSVRRRRPAVACTECRRRKIRCDQAIPCRHCEKAALRCIYNHLRPNISQSNITPPATARVIIPGSQSSANDSPQLTLSKDNKFHGFGSGSLDSDLSLDYVPPALPTSPSIFAEPNSVLSSVTQPLAWDIVPPETGVEFLAESDSVANLQGQIGELRDQHTAPWKEILHCDPDTFWFDSEDLRRMQRKIRDLELSLATSKMPSEWLYWSPGSTIPEVSSLIPQRATCDVLLELHVNTFESSIRILHIPSFYQEYRQYWESPDSTSDVFLCKLLLAMAIRTLFVPASPSAGQLADMRSRALAWMHYGHQWLFQKIVLDAQLNLDILQVGCLLLLCRHTSPTAIGDRHFWLSEDCLVRMAMKLGLHRDPHVRNPAMLGTEVEVRRRLWVTLLELSLQACLDAELPAPLPSDGGFDTELPSNLSDTDLGSVATLCDPKPRSFFTHSTMQILLAETQRIRIRILNLLYSPTTRIPYEEALKLASELRRVCNANLRLLQSFTPQAPGAVMPTEFQIKILDLWTRRFLLASICRRIGRIDASLLLLSYPLSHNTATGHSSPIGSYYPQLQISGQGIFKNVLRQATEAICQDLIQELVEDAFPITDRDPHTKLCQIIKDSISIYRTRMEQNQPCMREYVAFLCASAQIEALRSGWHGKYDIFPTAKKALGQCHHILESAQWSNSPEKNWAETMHVLDIDQGMNFQADLLSAPGVSPPSPPSSSSFFGAWTQTHSPLGSSSQ
ncbi:C6 zinc finger domain protein [Aspergillus fischeri NRRL 181]|uniref:C6 zinc finger domain protein n=1 Tax=Neosartorya fischeri (strain ATCC 1020 / DSM 3700 / CBS 544.65 / FGSC A1164 / JCM 1740 / NRRL 181 / WB 181) TaxID=331117 RepID=A1DJB1_NEOFI|nr:C6 zinc finger domain protein [Aspergillus fischeri NRRL 181]EAW16800.1 C6 zinc finger domain protein [Aspergillus fischeri NRRL 181]